MRYEFHTKDPEWGHLKIGTTINDLSLMFCVDPHVVRGVLGVSGDEIEYLRRNDQPVPPVLMAQILWHLAEVTDGHPHLEHEPYRLIDVVHRLALDRDPGFSIVYRLFVEYEEDPLGGYRSVKL